MRVTLSDLFGILTIYENKDRKWIAQQLRMFRKRGDIPRIVSRGKRWTLIGGFNRYTITLGG